MYYHLLVPLAIGALALAVLAIALGHNAYAAFFGLILSSTSQASNPLEWSYPATYLSGPALSSGWAVANCISAYGGMSPVVSAASLPLKQDSICTLTRLVVSDILEESATDQPYLHIFKE